MRFTQQWIYLADDEWGSELMERVATEAIGAWTGEGELVVYVYEHAGWSLTFAHIDGHIRCVSSANDAAVFPGRIGQFWGDFNQAYKDKQVSSVGEIRRKQKKESAVAAAWMSGRVA